MTKQAGATMKSPDNKDYYHSEGQNEAAKLDEMTQRKAERITTLFVQPNEPEWNERFNEVKKILKDSP
jgi:hypothetical protein